MSVRRTFMKSVEELWNDNKGRPVLIVILLCVMCFFFQMYCISACRSLVLIGYSWLTVFGVSTLVAGAVSTVVARTQPTPAFTYGLARAPVLVIFGSTVLAQLAAIFLIKESVEMVLEGESHVRTQPLFGGTWPWSSPLLLGGASAAASQLLAVYSTRNAPLQHVLTASSSSWLQEHAADLAHALCQLDSWGGCGELHCCSAAASQLLAVYSTRNAPLQHVLTASSSSWLQEHAADLAHALCQLDSWGGCGELHCCSAAASQLLAVYSTRNAPLQHVLTASSSSWLQEHAADLAHALCQVLPGLSSLLLPRLNPLAILNFCGGSLVLLTHYFLVHKALWWADPVLALCLSGAIVGSMLPLATYTGRILLQTSPPHLVGQLERCLREASTLDGVLELTQAHFWQLDFSKLIDFSKLVGMQLAHTTLMLWSGALVENLAAVGHQHLVAFSCRFPRRVWSARWNDVCERLLRWTGFRHTSRNSFRHTSGSWTSVNW